MSGRTRALVTVLGLDQHEAGALAIAQLLRDAGVEVIYTGRFNSPERIAAIASDEDVDVVGVSCHSWEFLHYAAELSSLLHAESPPIPIVVGGSLVTPADRDEVLARGVDAAVLPTASAGDAVATVLGLAAGRRGAREAAAPTAAGNRSGAGEAVGPPRGAREPRSSERAARAASRASGGLE